MSINNVYIIGLPSNNLNLFSTSILAQCVYSSLYGIPTRITNSSYTKINKDIIQISYIYNTIILEVQHITTLLDLLYILDFWMRSNQNPT